MLVSAPAAAEPPAAARDTAIQFSRDIAPILVQKCQGCHGAQKNKGGYRLDTFERLMRPGDSEAAPVVPGRPESSELFRLITSADDKKRMPQKDDPLPPDQVAKIRTWIEHSASFDRQDPTIPLQTLLHGSHPTAPSSYPHPLPAVSLSFHPTGHSLAVGGYHEVTLWDPSTGRLLHRLGDVAQQTLALAHSADGAHLAVAGGTPGSLGELRLFPTTSAPRSAPSSTPSTPPPTPSSPLPTHSAPTPRTLDRIADVMLAVSFSPDSTRLAAGGADGSVRVYEVATGERILRIEPHADWVTAVAFSPDGRRLASASRDRSARVFDAATGELLSAYPNHDEPLFALAWSPDGKTLYTAGKEREIHAWEPHTEAKKVREFKGFTADVLRLAVLGDHLYSTSADGKLRRHHRLTGELEKTHDLTPDHLPGLATHPATHTIATGAFDGTVKLLDARTGEVRSTFVASPSHK